MKNLLIVLFACVPVLSHSQDTFSIVAIDSVTGEIGSAGASCVPISLPVAPHGALIISDIIPGIGAIHTQAYWLAANQQNARARMMAGDSAQQIIDWLSQNDAQGNASIRQYGIVDVNGGHPRSAAFTGAGCNDYKNHITGPGYSIQGNILLGQHILDSMEAHYLTATGTLADKLMAALQGANVVGADTRCAQYGLSSLSSFLRVALPSDSAGNFHLDLYMAYPGNASYPVDPIDSLQTLYNNWLNGVSVTENPEQVPPVKLILQSGRITFIAGGVLQDEKLLLEMYSPAGKLMVRMPFSHQVTIDQEKQGLKTGVFLYRISLRQTMLQQGKMRF